MKSGRQPYYVCLEEASAGRLVLSAAWAAGAGGGVGTPVPAGIMSPGGEAAAPDGLAARGALRAAAGEG